MTRWSFLLLCALALGCRVTPGAPAVAAVLVEPSPEVFCNFSCLVMEVGGTLPLLATVQGREGEALELPVSWSSLNEAVATVSAEGLVRAVGPGQVEIQAAAGGVTGGLLLEVLPAPVGRIEVSPPSALLAGPGEVAAFTAKVFDRDGQEILGAEVSWSVANPFVLGVDAAGQATGEGEGATILFASFGDQAGTAQVTVGQAVPATPGASLGLVDGGITHSCGLDPEGRAFCWGWNFFGQLGDGNLGEELDIFPTPLAVAGDRRFVSLELGMYHSCALEADGDPFCWGLNDSGQIGQDDPQIGGTTIPFLVEGGLKFTQLSAGASHSCGLTAEGQAFCFGAGFAGALGNGSTENAKNPVAVAGGQSFVELRAGLESSCGLSPGGAAFCWGQNTFGQLGAGQVGRGITATPTPVLGGHSFTGLDLESGHACGVTAGGEVFCWGRNDFGQLGDGTTQDRGTPVRVDAAPVPFVEVTVGGFHSCARTAEGEVYCWGNNTSGQQGDLGLEPNLAAEPIAGGLSFTQIDAGGFQTCGITSGGQGYCWGSSFNGELGGGFGGGTAMSPAPWPISTP
jgi:hypothetical protein